MKVSIIMGSISDEKIGSQVKETLEDFGVDYDMRVISAHRATDMLLDYIGTFDDEGIDVVIALAGKAAHLAGVIAGGTTKPVIGVPIKSSTMDGMDSLLSTVQMPSGVPVATVAIDGGVNAALLAIQILALKDETLSEKLKSYKEELERKVIEQDETLRG